MEILSRKGCKTPANQPENSATHIPLDAGSDVGIHCRIPFVWGVGRAIYDTPQGSFSMVVPVIFIMILIPPWKNWVGKGMA
jgi:hypothetical protein